MWTYKTTFVKEIIEDGGKTQPAESLKKMAADPIERLHLEFLKWTLGIHKKASNISCWGDTGRCPLVQKISKQAVDFFERLCNMSYNNIDSLARHAFDEQRHLNLPWFVNMSSLIRHCQTSPTGNPSNQMSASLSVKEALQDKFQRTWMNAASNSSKLGIYKTVKSEISFSSYLNIRNRSVRRSLAQLRSSSHRLNIETARYMEPSFGTGSCKSNNKTSLSKEWSRCCKFCCSREVELLQQLPFAEESIVEDERHILATCPAYQHLRTHLSDHVKSSIVAWDERVPSLFEETSMMEFGLFVHKIFQHRFPKQGKSSTNVKKDRNATNEKDVSPSASQQPSQNNEIGHYNH